MAGYRHFKIARLCLLGSLACATLLPASAAPKPAPAVSPAKPVFDPALQTASEAASADHSLVMIVFSAQWCGPCREFKRVTLDSPEFREQAGALHIVDLDIDSHPKTAHDFSVQAVPTLVLMTGDGKIVERATGFMHTAELLLWLDEGRRRAKTGEWEGTAPGTRLAEFAKKAAGEGLNTNDLHRLITMLGDPDPADRAGAAQLLMAEREKIVPLLIEAAGNPYLGERIGASELLHRLAPDAAALDPWQSPTHLGPAISALRKWWAKTGRLPPPTAPHALDASDQSSLKDAIATLRSDDPVKRTDAMARLVRLGTEALPSVRNAIKHCERNGDQRSVALLEDVRWAILVPDGVEQRAGGVRQALARGSSPERQAAAARLGKVGRDALPALTELVDDPDPLVAEDAVRALSNIGGKDAIPAMAALLHASDSNLRMVAAQALGHTQNADAIKPLLTVFDDPNEIVCCTALSALEEIRAGDSYLPANKPLSPDVVTALKGCLADPRWRVRAAAAEVIGKLRGRKLVPDLKKLLDDQDSFVVKNTLTALSQLGSAPDVKQLEALGKRLPSLRSDTVNIMLQSQTTETIKTVTDIFNSGGATEQTAVLRALADHPVYGKTSTNNGWKPMLTRAVTASDERVRRAAVEALRQQSPGLAAELIGPLLSDNDAKTRAGAAEVVLSVLARQSGLPAASDSRDIPFGPAFLSEGTAGKTAKTNRVYATASQTANWHKALLRHAQSPPDCQVAAAIFATGDGKSDLPMIEAAFDKLDAAGVEKLENSMALAVVLSRLPWPAGKPFLDKLCGSPLLFALAARESGRAKSPAADYLLEPSQFRRAVERAHGKTLTDALQLIAGYGDSRGRTWSLWLQTDRTRAINLALAQSTNAGWKAAALFSLGTWKDAAQNTALFTNALSSSNAWVRVAAVQALARSIQNRPMLTNCLGAMVGDADLRVAATAALALLEPEVRAAADWEGSLRYFQFESVHGGVSSFTGTDDDRPLQALPGKPGFLAAARRWLAATNAPAAAPFALLLAQYGDFQGVDQLARQLHPTGESANLDLSHAVLAGIGLSRDPKYVPVLRRIAAAANDSDEMRAVLRALRGMTGRDARQLRLDINKRLRSGNASAPFIE